MMNLILLRLIFSIYVDWCLCKIKPFLVVVVVVVGGGGGGAGGGKTRSKGLKHPSPGTAQRPTNTRVRRDKVYRPIIVK